MVLGWFLTLVSILTLVQAIQVDDTSDQIVYSNNPTWQTGSTSQPATFIKWTSNSGGSASGGTFHQGLGYASTATFTFTGTAVAIYGIVPNKYLSTAIQFIVDGVTNPNLYKVSNPPDINQTGFKSAEDLNFGVQVLSLQNLDPKEHTIKLFMVDIDDMSTIFGLDYIEYTPVTTSSTQSSTQLSVNQQSTTSTTQTSTSSTSTTATRSTSNSGSTNGTSTVSQTTTIGGVTVSEVPDILPLDSRISYSPATAWNANNSCTLTSMTTATNAASLSFNFTGTDVSVYLSTSEHGGPYSISVDGISKADGNSYLAPTASSSCSIQSVWSISGLSNSAHTIVLTNKGSSDRSQGIIEFVGFRIKSFDQSNSNSSAKSSVNIPAIVGGVIGGIAALALFAFLIWFCLRRRQRRDETFKPTSPVVSSVTAFMHEAELSEKARMAQVYTIPPVPPARSTTTGSSSTYSGHAQPPIPLEPVSFSPPPSFRTRPISTFQPIINDSDPMETVPEVNQYRTTLPPYAEDVLARPDARNLSEADVDTIARRLAEVMRIQQEARGGPGLLRERMAPPEELIDQMVEEHLEANH